MSILYGNAFLQFLLLPLFVGVLGKNNFGEYVFYLSIVNWLIFATTLGSQTKIRQLFVRDEGNRKAIKETLILFFILSVIVASFSFLYFYFFELYPFIIISTLISLSFATSIFSLSNAFLIADNKVTYSALNQFAFSTIPLALFLMISNFYDLTYLTRFIISILIAMLVFCLNRKYFKDALSINRIVSYSKIKISFIDNVKIASNSLFDKIISQGDKLFIGMLFGFETLAIYAIGSQISNILQVSLKAFLVFLEQNIFKSAKGLFKEYFLTFTIGAVFSLFIYFAVKYFFLLLFSEEYLYVLTILPYQLLIVYLRAISSTQFTFDLVSNSHVRNLLVQYSTLSVFCFVIYNFKSLDVLIFVQLLTLMTVSSNLLNFSLRAATK